MNSYSRSQKSLATLASDGHAKNFSICHEHGGQQLPKKFPAHVSDKIFAGLEQQAKVLAAG
ncbi:MAG: hypothetical protein H7343_23675 [Undibacterium sp.]|nr:hypothetical protein [Opitutaceae bacterium]